MDRYIKFAVVLTILLLMVSYSSCAETKSGKCGDNLTWTLDDNGLLTISGNGDMDDYPGLEDDEDESNPNAVGSPWGLFRWDVKRVEILDGVTNIGQAAFMNTYASSISIPNSVTTIKDKAFSSCLISNIVIPNSVTSIGEYAFAGCRNLTSIFIPNSVTSIGTGALRCKNLTSIIIPDSVTSIGDELFSGCVNLTNVTLPNSLTSIPRSTFYMCNSLESITFPSSITSIGNFVFHTGDASRINKTLKTVYFTGDAPVIESKAFFNCTFTAYYPIKNSTYDESFKQNYGGDITWVGHCDHEHTVVDPAVRATCTESGKTEGVTCTICGETLVEQVIIPAKGHDWGDATYTWSVDNSSVTATHFCKNDITHLEVKTVGTNAVITSPTLSSKGSAVYTSDNFGSDGLEIQTKSLTIPRLNSLFVMDLPSNLTAIGDEAFMGVNCDAVIVPANCASIGRNAFSDCEYLMYVKVPSDTSIHPDAFDGCENIVVDFY